MTKWAVVAAGILLEQSGARAGVSELRMATQFGVGRHAEHFNAAQSLGGKPIGKGRYFQSQRAVATFP
jgi:hypothetical protein